MKALESVWTPTPKQAIALSCPAYELMYGGAKGGGKTDFLLFDHVNQHLMAHRYWEQRRIKSTTMALLLRKEFGRLKDLIQRSHTYFPILSEGAMTWKEAEHTWYCACGYRVWFGHCEGPQDHELYQGQEIGHLGIDQGEELPFNQYAYIKLQVRTSHAYLEPSLAVRVTANPGGRYGDWVKKRFVDPNRAGMETIAERAEIERNGVKTVITRERVFIPAFLWDNPHLSVAYEAELRMAPEHMRRAFLDGDWDVVEGSFFGDVFDPAIHVIDDLGPTEIRIPSNWPVFRHADWGSRSPASCHWTTIDNDGLLVVLDELYGPGETPDRWARRILEVEEKWGWTEKPRGWDDKRVSVSKLQGFLDPSCFKTDTAGGPTIAEVLFENGVNWFPADNERKAGWVEIRRRLVERGGASKKIPGLRITRRCVNLIRTLPNITSDKNDMDDCDTKQEDHACLVPDTWISGKNGPVQIKDLVGTTGEIAGPTGLVHYDRCWMTRQDAKTLYVEFSDGTIVQCTPDHRFLTPGNHWISAQNLLLRSGWQRLALPPSWCQSMAFARTAGLNLSPVWSTRADSAPVLRSVEAQSPTGAPKPTVQRSSVGSAASGSTESPIPGRPVATNAVGICVVSVRPAPNSDVYCFSVPGEHAFALANGVISHNCDGLRYGVMSRPRGRVESEMDESELKNWERVMMRQAAHTSTSGRNTTTGY